MALTAKQSLFIKEYLVDLNATQAAIRSGYSEKTAYRTGADNLRKPQIAAAIQDAMDERSERVEINSDEVLMDLAEMRDICMGRKPNPTEDVCAFNANGALKALELLGKHFKLFTEKVEVEKGRSHEERLELELLEP